MQHTQTFSWYDQTLGTYICDDEFFLDDANKAVRRSALAGDLDTLSGNHIMRAKNGATIRAVQTAAAEGCAHTKTVV